MSAPTKPIGTSVQSQYEHGPIHVLKQFWFYIGISLLLTIPGLIMMGVSMAHYPTHSPLRLGIDFTGGTLLQYGFVKPLNQETDIPKMTTLLEKAGVAHPIIQLQKAETGMKGLSGQITTEQIPDDKTAGNKPQAATSPQASSTSVRDLFKDANKPKADVGGKEETIQSIVSIRAQEVSPQTTIALQKSLKQNFGEYVRIQSYKVGPTLAGELFVKAAIGLLLAYALIVGYLTFRFQLDFAVAAIVALLHDTVFLLGAFSILGYFYHLEVDSMFVTAILTAIGFSVHDTIVVFDRIRENSKVMFTKKLPFVDIINISVNQTLARSINTSLTALLTLLALYFFGGESTRNFILALILGIATGTYSSIFVASCLLAWWRHHKSPNAHLKASSV